MIQLKSKKQRVAAAIVAVLGVGIIGAACNTSNTGSNQEAKVSNSIDKQFQQAQPIPQYSYSQLRQTLIDIETAQAHVTQTTTFFFNQGVSAPIAQCSSIGFPVATTDQITAPSYPNQNVGGADDPVVPQIDPNGVYTGDSSGTYVVCVANNGTTYAQYWEGFVDTVSGPAVWNKTTNAVQLTGPSSAKFKVGK